MGKTIKSHMIRWNLMMILLVTVCISGLHMYHIYRYTVRMNQEEMATMSKQAQNSLNHMLNQLDVLQYQITESLTRSAEYEKGGSGWTREGLAFLKDAENQFQTFRRAVPFVTDIYWLDDYGKLYTTDSSVNRELFEENLSRCRLDGDAGYVLPFRPAYRTEGDNALVFSYLKNLYRINKGRGKRGILQIDMDASYMEEFLKPINRDPYCLAYIAREDGTSVWLPRQAEGEGSGEGASSALLSEGNRHWDYGLVCPLDNGWQLHIIYNNDFALKSLKDNLASLIILLLILIPLSILGVYKYSGYLTEPLQKLTERMKQLESGRLVEIRTVSRFEEIRILEQGYNSMIAEMDDMMTKMTEIKTENIHAKLLALQAQINPHFLANSFELIRSLAIQGHRNDIETIAEALAMMYRYILNDSQEKVTFEEELDYVKNYIRIQEYRFKRSIQVLYRVDFQALKCRMARLLIQPLVENAFIHGLELKEGIRWIMLTGTVREGKLYVEVKDNGLGMEPERLSLLLEDITDYARRDQVQARKPEGGGSSIGLKNINKRLYLTYGEESCLKVASKPEEGTAVSFCITAEKEEAYGGTESDCGG